MSTGSRRGARTLVLVTALVLLGSVTIVFGVIRMTDIANSISLFEPPGEFEVRYVRHPVISYLHIIFGSIFLVLGPFQFVPRLRRRWPSLHRWSGRTFIVAGLLSGLSALYMAVAFPAFGGWLTQTATFAFGVYLVIALTMAYRHIRRREISSHREWMIRSFAIGLAVSTIRLYILLFQLFTDYTFEESFGPCFWLAFCTHAVVAELWIRKTR